MLTEKGKRKVSQAEVAKRAGVSRTTVSFVLNGRMDITIREKTKRRVMQAIKELEYTYPGSASAKKTGNIGYLIPPRINLSEPYYHRFFSGVEEASKKLGQNVIVETWEKSLPPLLWNNKVDGIIIEEQVTEEEIKQIQKYVPVVILNHTLDNTICDMVMPDNQGGIKQAFSYLYELGHRRIGFFGLTSPGGISPGSIHIRERLEGYYQALKVHHLPVNKEYIYLPPAKVGGIKEMEAYAREILKKWKSLPNLPTGVITIGDIYGIPLIKIALSLKIKVPQDLSVIGFDNTIACHYVSPTLSSIGQNMEEMGRLSVELLKKRIKEGNSTPFRKIICGTELVVRESVGEIKKG